MDRLGIPKEEPFHNALDDALYTARVCCKLPLAEGLATYPTEEELLTEALLGAENTGPRREAVHEPHGTRRLPQRA